MLKAIPAKPEHIDAIAPLMRKADADECYATSFRNPREALEFSLAASTLAWTVLKDGEPVCMFGVGAQSLFDFTGHPWMLGTDAVDSFGREFLRQNKEYVVRMMEAHPFLVNYVDCRNKKSIKWLKWLGFIFDNPASYGTMGLPFHRFYMIRENYV